MASGYAVALHSTFSGICRSVTFTMLFETVMFSGGSENFQIYNSLGSVYYYTPIGLTTATLKHISLGSFKYKIYKVIKKIIIKMFYSRYNNQILYQYQG